MFQMTTADGVPMTVRLSFWQWMKAGMGFTLGAAAVSVLAFLVTFLVPGAFLYIASAMLRHLR